MTAKANLAASVAARFEHKLAITCVRQLPSRGPAAARNLGAERARGSLLVFIDDDCTASAGWVTAFEKADATQADGRALLGGRVENALPENVFSAASQQLQLLEALRVVRLAKVERHQYRIGAAAGTLRHQ